MQQNWLKQVQSYFTPAYKKTVDEHILMDQTTRGLIKDTEELLVRMAENAPPHNQNKTIRRKQKEWTIKVKVNYTFISVLMADTKQSKSPIRKRIHIKCHRRYMKSDGGVGICQEAAIHYIKDGRSQTRSVQDSALFHTIFYQIHHLDLAFSNEQAQPYSEAKSALLKEQEILQSAALNDFTLLIEEMNRYAQSVKKFTIDSTIDHQLQRLINHASKLQDDFLLLDYEDRHTVRRMLRDDIPKLLHTFLSLSTKNQLEHKEGLYIALSKMELTLIRYVEQLEKARVEQMNFLLELQSLRYDKS